MIKCINVENQLDEKSWENALNQLRKLNPTGLTIKEEQIGGKFIVSLFPVVKYEYFTEIVYHNKNFLSLTNNEIRQKCRAVLAARCEYI